jgi:phosphoglycerol transferase MdoB-like AlkP superfamily enzyme
MRSSVSLTRPKKSPWFQNTIFVMVADHANQIFYPEYAKPIQRFAVPILIYQPGSKYVGVDEDWAQQIDIYPTILDMIGYQSRLGVGAGVCLIKKIWHRT